MHLGACARAALSRPPPSLPCLVLDLDETLLYRRGVLDRVALYAWRTAGVGVPYAQALPSLHALSSAYSLVAVTARYALAEANTARWLAAQGLPGLPVVYAAGVHAGDASRGAFKAGAIRHLRAAGWAPVAGVGDRPSDLEAYASEGLQALMVVHAEGSRGGEGARAAAGLLQAQARFPRASVAYFSDCAQARAALGLPSAAPPAPLWQQVAAHLLGPAGAAARGEGQGGGARGERAQ